MMSKQRQQAIWIVDDDTDDHELIREAFLEIKTSIPVELFCDAEAFIKHLDEAAVAPFIIICDVNLPGTNGFALREHMLQAANNKFHSVPFIFWSTQASESHIRQAYRLRAQGFFLKESAFSDWKKSLVRIIDYWTTCLTPSKDDKPDPPMD